jgi:hypothetical protein
MMTSQKNAIIEALGPRCCRAQRAHSSAAPGSAVGASRGAARCSTWGTRKHRGLPADTMGKPCVEPWEPWEHGDFTKIHWKIKTFFLKHWVFQQKKIMNWGFK